MVIYLLTVKIWTFLLHNILIRLSSKYTSSGTCFVSTLREGQLSPGENISRTGTRWIILSWDYTQSYDTLLRTSLTKTSVTPNLLFCVLNSYFSRFSRQLCLILEPTQRIGGTRGQRCRLCPLLWDYVCIFRMKKDKVL